MTLSCSLWEYDNPSNPLEQKTPETYLSLIATDTIFAYQDTVTGEWHYDLGDIPDTTQILDTLKNAFTDTFTSRHELHWWGEDSDGDIIGYQYRWKDGESGIFSNTINVSGGNTDYDLVFGFSPYATDGYDSGIDLYAPPAPPPPTFDAALFWDNNRYYTQILYGPAQDTVEWDIQLQYPEDNTIILTLDNTGWDTLNTFILQDAFGGLLGIDVDMTVETSLTLNNLYITILKLKVIPGSLSIFNENDLKVPQDYSLFQNYPNPFNPVTQITYSIPQQSYIVLEIFDLTGAHMKTLVDGKQNSGMQTVQWDGTDKNGILVGTGVYLYRINSNSFSQTRKMVLIK